MTTEQIPSEERSERESHFAEFVAGPLTAFWQRRQEWQFIGVDNVPIRCVRFADPSHSKVLVIVSGFLESYVKYQELIYDFFLSGYDILMYDHRGQGFSGRMLADSHAVYVERFSDYVDDLETFWRDNVQASAYKQRYLLGHSMGGAVTALFLSRHPQAVNAVVLSVPMMGIRLPMPKCCANALISITQRSDYLRKRYVFKRKAPLPFVLNQSCGSEVRYRHVVDQYNRYPEIRLFGPTYHWVKEAMQAGKRAIASAALITTPLLLLQAGKERLVDNGAHRPFIDALREAGHGRPGEGLTHYKEAAHEILFDRDETRLRAFNQVIHFFEQYQ